MRPTYYFLYDGWVMWRRVQKRLHHKNKNIFAFQHFGYHVSVEHDENHPQPKFGGNQFMGPEIWPHEYLISLFQMLFEISVNWSGFKHNEQVQFTLISMGLTRYSCGHISGHHEPNSCQIWCTRVFHHVLLKYGHENAEMQKKKKKKKKFDDVTLQYSIVDYTKISIAMILNR